MAASIRKPARRKYSSMRCQTLVFRSGISMSATSSKVLQAKTEMCIRDSKYFFWGLLGYGRAGNYIGFLFFYLPFIALIMVLICLLYTSHHLDTPWRPSDLQQRDGRGVRAGHEIAKHFAGNNVDVIIYAVEKSLDSYKSVSYTHLSVC